MIQGCTRAHVLRTTDRYDGTVHTLVGHLRTIISEAGRHPGEARRRHTMPDIQQQHMLHHN